MQPKCPPQWILVSTFYLCSRCELVLKNNVHRVNQKQDKILSLPEAVLENLTGGEEERAQTEHMQMSFWAIAMKMFLLGTDTQEPWRGTACSEK